MWGVQNVTVMVNGIDGVMANVLTSRVVNRGFEPLSDQAKDYNLLR